MLFREQVAHTAPLDSRRNRGEPFTVISHKADRVQIPVSSSSPPLVSPRSGRAASLFQNHQDTRYGWQLMIFREQVANTALLDPRRNRGEPFTVILHPFGRFLTSYFVPSSGTSVRKGKTITSSFFRNVVSLPVLRNKTASLLLL